MSCLYRLNTDETLDQRDLRIVHIEFVQAIVKVALLSAEIIAQIGETKEELEKTLQLLLILAVQVVDLNLVDAFEEAHDVGVNFRSISRLERLKRS